MATYELWHHVGNLLVMATAHLATAEFTPHADATTLDSLRSMGRRSGVSFGCFWNRWACTSTRVQACGAGIRGNASAQTCVQTRVQTCVAP